MSASKRINEAVAVSKKNRQCEEIIFALMDDPDAWSSIIEHMMRKHLMNNDKYRNELFKVITSEG